MRRFAVIAAVFAVALLTLAGCASKGHGPVWATPDTAHRVGLCASEDCGPYAATLRWSTIPFPGHTATGYFTYLDGTQEADVTASPWTVGGMDCGTTYTLGVRAHDDASHESGLYTTDYATPSCGTTTTTSSTTTTDVSCTTNVTTSTFTSAVSSASAGDVLCLASGSYGTFSGTNKAITITTQPDASVTLGFDLASGDSGFTIDGTAGGGTMTSAGGDIDNASDITIKNVGFTDSTTVTDGTNMSIVFDHDSFDSNGTTFNDDSSCNPPARIHLAYSDGGQSGVTVENSTFIDPSGGISNAQDGIQTGEGMTITNNVFENILDNGGECHQDAIQGVGATHVTVTGNLFINDEDGFANFDGAGDDTVTDNACRNLGRGSCITLYSDSDSTVNHNTAIGMNSVELDNKTGSAGGAGTIVENNIGDISISDQSTASVQTHNLYAGATSPDISGSPTLAGGSTPTTWDGFELASGSTGKSAATDGSDVGIRASAGGPP